MTSQDLALSNEWRAKHVLSPQATQDTQTLCPSPNASTLVYQGVAPVRLEQGALQDFVLTVFQHHDIGSTHASEELQLVLYASHITDNYHLETRVPGSELGVVTAQDSMTRREKIKGALASLEIHNGQLHISPPQTAAAAGFTPFPSPVHDIGLQLREDEPQLHSPLAEAGAAGPGMSRHPEAQDAAVLQGIRERGGVRIRVITWNMHAKPPPEASELKKRMLPVDSYDCFVIGTEECENSIAMSAFKPSKERWESVLREALGTEFEMLCGHTLQATHCIVFLRRELVCFVTKLNSAAVSTGIGFGQNRLGNKGAVAITFSLGNKALLFINAHLAHARQGLQNRNAEYHKITSQLARELLDVKGLGDMSEDEAIEQLLSDMDYVVWAGDLNYRLEMEREDVLDLLSSDRLPELLEADQLVQARRNHDAFQGLEEAAINFRPTYKYDSGTNEFDSSKKLRTPAWTDRILYKAAKGFRVEEYTSIQNVLISDHRPVYLSAEVELDLVSPSGSGADGQTEEQNLGQNTSQVCAVM